MDGLGTEGGMFWIREMMQAEFQKKNKNERTLQRQV